jgi:hypothetical protein
MCFVDCTDTEKKKNLVLLFLIVLIKNEMKGKKRKEERCYSLVGESHPF